MERRDGRAELPPLLRVRRGEREGTAADTEGLRADADATRIEPGHGHFAEALSLRAKHGACRDTHAFERHGARLRRREPELPLGLGHGDARRLGRHEERGDPGVRPRGLGDADAGEHDEERRVASARDEELPALDDPRVAVALRGRPQ